MFLSPEFAYSFLLFLIIYWGLGRLSLNFAPQRHNQVQNIALLLGAILLFTLQDYAFLLIVLSFSLVQWALFAVVFKYSKSNKKPVATPALIAFLTVILLYLLCVSKYYLPVRDWLILQTSWAWLASLPDFKLTQSMSLSFFVFQAMTMSTLLQAKRVGLFHIALFNGFALTLFAGPILRANNLVPQLQSLNARQIRFFDVAIGRIALGVFKKLVLAYYLGLYFVDPVFADPSAHHALWVLAAIVAYAWQIYFDFSGLSDMVIGMAMLLGLRIPANFNRPYLARNIQHFWRRWHISLSTWIRDYIYIPLGGNKHGWFKAQIYLGVAMMLSGIWHGAAMTFLVWAFMHVLAQWVFKGYNLLLQKTKNGVQRKTLVLPSWASYGLTFAWVCAAWVFFRASSLNEAMAVFTGLLQWDIDMNTAQWRHLLLFTIFITLCFYVSSKGARIAQVVHTVTSRLALFWRVALSAVFIYLAIELGPSGVPNFIYANF